MIGKIFSYKDHSYVVLCLAEMKNPINRKWEGCVIYKQQQTGKIFVREYQDFLDKFEPEDEK